MLRSYLRMIVFSAILLMGIQLPSYVDRYVQTVEAHYQEAKQAISEFQDEANRYFDGSLTALIRYYDNSNDPVFIAGGESISGLKDRYQALMLHRKDLDRSTYWRYRMALLQPLSDIRKEVQSSYNYAVTLNIESIVVGLLLALFFSLLLEILLIFFARVLLK